jgi:hypothetical protein
MAKKKTINWQQAAGDATKWVSQVMSEAHREVTPWHRPSNTWLAFDTQCPDEDPEGYLEILSGHLDDYGYEVRAAALSEDKGSLAVLYTFGTDMQGGDEVFIARLLLWESWRAEAKFDNRRHAQAETKGSEEGPRPVRGRPKKDCCGPNRTLFD